jgi:predicted dehydrogenase
MNEQSPTERRPIGGGSNRREFLSTAAVAGAALALPRRARAASANDKVVAAIMGANNRGSYLAGLWTKEPNVEIAYVCDPDEQAVAKGVAAVKSGGQSATPQGVKDFRRALDDKGVDVLICAAPDHWHAAATTLALAAGKHVYVEKPCSYNGHEGELMVEAARKHGRVVQVGMQRRSGPLYREFVERIHGGAIGRTLYARSWYNAERPTIGRGNATAPPAWLDYALWQGPAPDRPYKDNLIHYNWHFFWHWGANEIGNNGVHTIDICRWALGVDFPRRVTAAGGKYRFPDDDQETPDNMSAVFDFGDKSIVWEGIAWSSNPTTPSGIGIEIRGETGSALIDDDGYAIYDLDRKKIGEGKGSRGDQEHQADALSAIREGRTPNADIDEGHKTAVLCHLGNIAFRLGRTVAVDPATGRVEGDDAQALWTREYRPGWEPKV